MGLAAEVSLPQGVIDDKQCVKIQDLLNWGGMLMFDRKWKGQEKEAEEFKARHYKALHAWGRSRAPQELRTDPRLRRQGRRASDHPRRVRRDHGNA